MKIGSKSFKNCLEIISRSNSITISINVPVTDNYSNVYAILIHESNSSIISSLEKENYSLSMCKKGLTISDFKRNDSNQF